LYNPANPRALQTQIISSTNSFAILWAFSLAVEELGPEDIVTEKFWYQKFCRTTYPISTKINFAEKIYTTLKFSVEVCPAIFSTL